MIVGAKRAPGQNAHLFKKGQIANPKGRPRNSIHQITAKEHARAHTEVAIAALVEVATQKGDQRARVMAAESLLNRGWGKPVETQYLNVAKRDVIESGRSAIGSRRSRRFSRSYRFCPDPYHEPYRSRVPPPVDGYDTMKQKTERRLEDLERDTGEAGQG